MAFFEQGSRVWFKIAEKNLWMAATSTGTDGQTSTFQGDDGQQYTIPNDQMTPDSVSNMHETSQHGMEDMAKLADLHEGAILHNIALRYRSNYIYTLIGSILSAVNPYKGMGELYSDTTMASYKEKPIGEKPPHIFAIANEAYYAMWKSDANQVVLISGESGAGKTESTKFIMRYLSYLSNEKGRGAMDNKKKSFEDQILQSSPILEAFGNAKTVYNNNSSRFGKFVKVSFSSGGVIEGGRIIDYLLEKNRVVRQNKGERNFHIFYQLLSGPAAASLGLAKDPKKFYYLNQSGVVSDPTINDPEDWSRVVSAFEAMGFTSQQQQEVLSVLSGILLLGNVEFIVAGGAQIANESELAKVGKFLGLDPTTVGEMLTNITRELRGEVITTPLDLAQAADARDSLSMALYSQLFKWIISKLNVSLKGNDGFHSIGVLDIFGFENFQENSLEQFNINYANEKLQQYFNKHIFSLEQLEYNREGINWSEIEWVDNGECLDLIERKLGVQSLLDEESRFPKGTDESLLGKLHSSHAGNSAFYIKPRVANSKFGIKHYAGDVFYETKGFLEKNRDQFRSDFLAMLQQSSVDFVYDLFEFMETDSGSNTKTARKKPTVSLQFKESLGHLMQSLSAASPFFVRCLKPNARKAKDDFDYDLVLNQLRYSGMLETVRIRRAGYPVRRIFADFIFRYRVLALGINKQLEVKQQCAEVLKKFDAKGKDWQVGSSKIFLRESLETVIERKRQEALRVTVMKIQALILAHIQRKRYLRMRKVLIALQAAYKRIHYTKIYQTKRKAAIKIESVYRGYKARQLRAKLAEEKRIAEEKRREEERRIAEQKRLEMERLEKEAREKAESRAKLEEARRLQELEERAKAEAEARKKVEQEAQRKADLDKARALEAELTAREEQARLKAEEEKRKQEEAKKMAEAEAQRKATEIKERAEREAQIKEMENQRRRENEEARIEEAEEKAGVEEEAASEDREGYLGMYRGIAQNLKRRWCVLHDGTFMWFKGKQDFIKAGWLTKMGGGTSTLGRKNWKRRWFTLKGGILYYLPDENDDAEVLGEVDVQNCQEIVTEDLPVKKENCFSIITAKRTYFMYTDTPEEMNEWVETLKTVKGKSNDEIKSMMADARIDPRNAQGTIDLDDILSVGPGNKTDNEGHPIFVVMTADQVTKFVAKDVGEMDEWVRVLQPKRSSGSSDGEAATERGYMLKAGGKDGKGILRKRWFVLRGDVISYYKTKDDDSLISSIPLNSLCSVIPPQDEAQAALKNEWTFTVHSKLKSYRLTCRTQADCTRWINAVQDVIDNAPVIETQTEQIIDELKSVNPSEVEWMYASHKILSYSPEPLRAPLLPLPYGETGVSNSGRTYGSLQEEAVKFSTSLCPVEPNKPAAARYGSPSNPVEMIKTMIQACFDLPKLRNEIYCEVIKQTTNVPNPGSPSNMTHWHLLAALTCSFLPARKFVRFLRFHLRRTLEMADKVGADVCQVANFCLESLKRTKTRDFPPSTQEIEAIMSHQTLKVSVLTVGSRVFELPVNSSTTCGEVIATIKKELGLTSARNGFGLFESCGSVDKYLEEKYSVADVLSKWEKYEAHGINPDGDRWKLVFKLFAFFDPLSKNLSPTEQEFMFEQAFENVMCRRFPANDDTQIKLAALRTQYVVGDYEDGAYVSDMIKVHPAQEAQLLAPDHAGGGAGAAGTMKKAPTIKGTLRGLGMNTLRLLKGGTVKKGSTVSDADMVKIKEKIVQDWKKLRGMKADDARRAYMDIIQAWEGYGANMFEVEQTTHKQWPKELWLAISLHGVGIFPRGEPQRLAFYKYETVLSFGAPVANKYKIMVDNVGSMLFETNMVLEIAKLMKEYIKEIVTRRPKQ